MARHWKIAIAILGVFALFAVFSFPALFRSVLGLKRATVTEEQAHRAIVQPSISTPTDTPEMAQLFWASSISPESLDAATVELPLSADPVQRGKQLIAALIERAPSPEQRTLPADAELLEFYLLPDGTAVADFSEVLGTETPSGILSEQRVVESISRTLAANLSGVTRLKILIRGQSPDTLAGHLDLTGFFPVAAPAPPAPSLTPTTAVGSVVPAGAATRPVVPAAPQASPAPSAATAPVAAPTSAPH